MLQNAAEARSSFLGGHNIAVLVDRSLSTEHERNIAAYLQVNRRLVRNSVIGVLRSLARYVRRASLVFLFAATKQFELLAT